MRNRHAERSKRRLFFRVFGVLAIIFLVWVIFFLPDSQNEEKVSREPDTLAQNDTETIPAEVSDFITFVKLSTDTVVSEETSAYASMGIEQLSVTLESFIQRNSSEYHSLIRQTDELKNISKELTQKDKDNSSKTRKAFLIAADLLKSLKGNEVKISLKEKAETIKEDVVLEQQLDNVKSYFASFADALKEMTGIEERSML